MVKRKLYECGEDVGSCVRWLKRAQENRWLTCSDFEVLNIHYGKSDDFKGMDAKSKTHRMSEEMSVKMLQKKCPRKLQKKFCKDIQQLCAKKINEKRLRVDQAFQRYQKHQEILKQIYLILSRYDAYHMLPAPTSLNPLNRLKIFISSWNKWFEIGLISNPNLRENFQKAISYKASAFSLNMLKQCVSFVLCDRHASVFHPYNAGLVYGPIMYGDWLCWGHQHSIEKIVITLEEIIEADKMQTIQSNPSPWIERLAPHFLHIHDLAKLTLLFLTPPS
jgi:hypothetical protein